MDVVSELHTIISRTSILFFALLGAWGVIRAFRKQGVDGSYLAAAVIGESVFILQALLGLTLVIGGARPGRTMHFLYGAVALIALPALFAYTKGDDSNQAQWYYAILALMLTGIAFRAISTAV
jgi:heme A synthase